MTKEDILTKLREVMRASSQESMDWDAVTPEQTIEELGFDSLSILDLVYDIQQEFDIDFEAEELVSVRTVNDLVAFLEERLA